MGYLIEDRKEPLSNKTAEALLTLLESNDKQYNNYIKNNLMRLFSIEKKEELINSIKDRNLVSVIIESLPTELKLKYVNKVGKDYRTRIIKSIKEDDVKAKFVTYTTREKGEIIYSIKDDKIKEELLLKNKLLLSGEELGQIIASFNDNKYLEKYLYLLKSEKAKIEFIRQTGDDKRTYQLEMLKQIKKKKNIIENIYIVYMNNDKVEVIKQIDDQEILKDLLTTSDEECNHLIMQKLNEKTREEIIGYEREFGHITHFYQYIENDEFLYETILHTLYFPDYNESYNNIITRIANYAHYDEKRLLKLVQIFDMSILAKLENINIKNLLNASEEDFNKITNLFSEEVISFAENNQNDALSSLIQRKFRITHPNDILIFTNTLHAATDGKEEIVRTLVDTVLEVVSLERFAITKEELIIGLLNKDSKIIKKYNTITNEYLTILRANHDIEQKALAEKLYKDYTYDKNSLSKYIFKYLSANRIMNEIEDVLTKKRVDCELTEEEIALVNNKELLKQIIAYKKDPQSFTKVPKEIKDNIKTTEEIIRKVFSPFRFNSVQKNSSIKPTSKKQFVDILCELNVEQIINTYLNDEEVYQELLDLLKKKKISSWLGRFGNLPEEADVDLYPSTIASLISNYKEIRKHVFKEEANKTKGVLISFVSDYKEKNIEKLLIENLKNQNGSKNDTILLINQIANITKIPIETLVKKLLVSAKMYRNDNLETAINVLNPEIKSQFNKDFIKQVLDRINNMCWILSYDSIIKPSQISPTEKELTDYLKTIDQINHNIPDMGELVLLENIFDSAIVYNSNGLEDALANVNNKIKEKYSNEVIANLLKDTCTFIRTIKKSTIVSSTSLLDIANCYDSSSLVLRIVIGKEDFDLIKRNPAPYRGEFTSEQRIGISVDLAKEMHEREYITVPPSREIYELSNNKQIKISVGDLHNFDNLTLGERTGACMRIGGAGYSLFNFCLKNDNGFHVKFMDPENDKLVSRVSGFRNGNTVFLNQLRYSLSEKYTNENIVEACRLFAQKLIEDSKESRYPIENVVISPAYAMEKHSNEVRDLGKIEIQKGFDKFYTDVSSNAIVLATSNPDNSLVPVKTGPNEVEKYKGLRREIKKEYGLNAYLLKNQILLL